MNWMLDKQNYYQILKQWDVLNFAMIHHVSNAQIQNPVYVFFDLSRGDNENYISPYVLLQSHPLLLLVKVPIKNMTFHIYLVPNILPNCLYLMYSFKSIYLINIKYIPYQIYISYPIYTLKR